MYDFVLSNHFQAKSTPEFQSPSKYKTRDYIFIIFFTMRLGPDH